MPRPHIGNRRARFYFTEAGWHKIGRAVLMDARLEDGARESTVFRGIARGAVFTVVGLIAPAA